MRLDFRVKGIPSATARRRLATYAAFSDAGQLPVLERTSRPASCRCSDDFVDAGSLLHLTPSCRAHSGYIDESTLRWIGNED